MEYRLLVQHQATLKDKRQVALPVQLAPTHISCEQERWQREREKVAHLLLVGQAGPEQAHRQAQVLGVLHLLPEQLLLAVPGQQRAVGGQALLHLARLWLGFRAAALHIRLQPKRTI